MSGDESRFEGLSKEIVTIKWPDPSTLDAADICSYAAKPDGQDNTCF